MTTDPPHLVETFDATKTTYDTAVKCTSTQLVRVDKNTYDRAAPTLAKSVLGADGTSWQGVSYK